MRITYLSNSYIPSSTANSVHVMRMCEALAKLDTRPCLVHPGNRRKELFNVKATDFYGLRKAFPKIRIPELPVPGKAEFYGVLAAATAKTRQSNIVYCRDIFSCYRALDFGIKAAFELHMLPMPGSKSEKYLHRIVRHKNFIRLVVITNALKKESTHLFNLQDDRVVVVPDAANEPTDGETAELGTPGELQIGYIGSLLPGKGVELIPKIAALCPWAFFHVVGGTETQVNQQREKHRTIENIRFHGFVPPGMTYRYLLAFDVVLAPNQKRVLVEGGNDIGRFTSPLKIFEYMLAGKPIVASDIDVLKEVLENDINAILCEPESPKHWADALCRLRSSHALQTRLGSTAKSMALDALTWSKRAEKILEIIQA